MARGCYLRLTWLGDATDDWIAGIGSSTSVVEISMQWTIFGVLALLLVAMGTANAGPARDGVRAFNRHDYARAAWIFFNGGR